MSYSTGKIDTPQISPWWFLTWVPSPKASVLDHNTVTVRTPHPENKY